MAVKKRHLLQQGPVIASLLRAATRALKETPSEPLATPTPVVRKTIGPRDRQMVADYVRWAGGSPSSYKGIVPPHLFPQWGLPMMADTLVGIPYDITRVLNGGCRFEVNGDLPIGEDLVLAANLESIDDNGSRAVLRQKLVTGTASSPEALVAYGYNIVPLGKKKDGERRQRPRVPADVKEIARRRLRSDEGLSFALLTGDFNPVHWVGPYARAAGFRNTIMHGYGTLAVAVEALNKILFSGDVHRLRSVDVRFTRPLVLPHDIGVFIDNKGGLYVGDHPDGPAFMTGAYTHD